jgi:hypothetical protein
MRRVAKKLVYAALAIAAVFLIYPIEQTTAPDWQVTVIDDKGVRLAGVGVRESWRQHSFEAKDYEEVAKTDASGSVHFPKRTLKSSYLRRMYGCYRERQTKDPQAICGPQASVWAFGPGLGTLHTEDTLDNAARYVSNETLPDVMVEQQTTMIMLHHCPPGRFGAGCKLSEEYAPGASR